MRLIAVPNGTLGRSVDGRRVAIRAARMRESTRMSVMNDGNVNEFPRARGRRSEPIGATARDRRNYGRSAKRLNKYRRYVPWRRFNIRKYRSSARDVLDDAPRALTKYRTLIVRGNFLPQPRALLLRNARETLEFLVGPTRGVGHTRPRFLSGGLCVGGAMLL